MIVLKSSIFSHPIVESILALPTSHLLLAAAGIYLFVKFLVVLYRISAFHPLAKIPGPRLAAATWWYRTYYEIWPHQGRLMDHIHSLHEKYGSVVRLSPNEVHFNTPSAYHQIYSHSSKANKAPAHYDCYNEALASFGFSDPALSKERRDLLSPFFSRRNILNMQYVVEDKLCLLTHRLRELYSANPQGHPIDMMYATKSFTVDVIMEFCFAHTMNVLRSPGLTHTLLSGTEQAMPMFCVFKHFPVVQHLVMNLPDWLALWLAPSTSGVLMLKNTISDRVDQFLQDPEGMGSAVGHEVIYHRLLGLGKFAEKRQNGELLPPPKISREGLNQEAQSLMFGGTDTVGNTLTIGMYYILTTPGVVERMMEELRSVWPGNPWVGMPAVGEEYIDESGRLPASVGWEVLEKLPYLTAVIKESLRLSYGTVSPLERLAPPQGITIDGFRFPGGTGIASSTPSIHLDPTAYPNPHTFQPERWMGPGAAALAERSFVPFSRGPRQCLGMNLGWCELYLSFATLYRRFEFELIDTKPEDIYFRDYMIPLWEGRIKVRAKPRVD